MRVSGVVHANNFARGIIVTNGTLFATLGIQAMKVAPHPGLKLFGAGFATIGIGLLMMASSGEKIKSF